MRAWGLAIAGVMTLGCGGSPSKPDAKPTDDGRMTRTCREAAVRVKSRLGPEFHSVVSGLSLMLPVAPKVMKPGGEPEPQPPVEGCALVYLPLSEELPGETDDAVALGDDQRLVLALPDDAGGLQINFALGSRSLPGATQIKTQFMDLTGDGRPEVVVEHNIKQKGAPARALQIFSVTAGGTPPAVLMDTRMQLKTPEGLDMIPTWKAGQHGGHPAIIFDAVGILETWRWTGASGQFERLQPPAPAKPEAKSGPAAEAKGDGEAKPQGTPGTTATPKAAPAVKTPAPAKKEGT